MKSLRFFLGKALLGLAILILPGCQTPTIVKTETVEVKVPVAVQPITPDQVPSPPAPLPPRPADARDALDVAVGKWCEAVAYILRANPLLQISAGETVTELSYPECRAR